MKSIKFVQWSSSILLVLTVMWLLIMSTLSAFFDLKITVEGIAKIGGVVLLFVLPEKGSAFFGPHFKRKSGGENG